MLGGLKSLAGDLSSSQDMLQKLAKFNLTYDTLAAASVVECLRSELTDRGDLEYSTYARAPGVFEWLATLQDAILKFDGLDEDGQMDALDDVAQEMALHSSSVEYCMEALQEAFEEAVQQRLAHSFASRR